MEEEISKCLVCDKETKHNNKFRFKNHPFVWALSCTVCGENKYY